MPPGIGFLRVCEQMLVFCVGVGAAVATGDDPQHTVIVERDVPLHVAGRGL